MTPSTSSSHRNRWILPSAAVFAACGVLANCGSPTDVPGSTVPGTCQVSPPLLRAVQTDILFVIDNSGSMKEEQAAVATELPAFVQALEAGGGLEQDFRVAVTTSSVYQNAYLPDGGTSYRDFGPSGQAGRLQAVPDAGDRMLARGDPELIEKFSRLVQVGINGSGHESPFEAARLALSAPLATLDVAEGGTRGFLRDGARLLLVMVSDEDDCSERVDGGVDVAVGQDPARDWCREQQALLDPVTAYYEFFQGLTDSNGEAREVLWAAIAPVAISDKRAEAEIDNGFLRNVDCPTSFQPGHRHREMAGLFDPSLSNLDSICSPSFRDSLIRIADLANTVSTVEVMNVPDPALLVVTIGRADGRVENCTVANGGITFEPGQNDVPDRVRFHPPCLRRADDTDVQVKLLCAG